jgi:GNAT superfamily N-acetyltransferase
MTIRRANADDARKIAEVHVASWRTTYHGIVPAEKLASLSVDERAEMWLKAIADEDTKQHVFVAEIENAIIGFASCGPNRDKTSEYTGELRGIYLLEEFQKRGIGTALTCAAAQSLLDRAMSSMLVWVLAENSARKFYEAMGGVYAGAKVIEIGGKALEEVCYGWRDIRVGRLSREHRGE